ncbi:labd-13Z-ene-9,15,16-triol synthase, chloroplastic-like [Juglans microcarpa x Juglans regia]|uniref:labd-13Z-ene-9,15,16-triol synthase, chloroplastic-like n=1 Tax=Juglans microcarpa x Juglans regia TaxID=2249226 RepID=UPI001B7F18B3|nr:labd-13Z-ene-9,15,16-triol synthase, chloroplastic-like [Juglans microcarpa x Juglans regia]
MITFSRSQIKLCMLNIGVSAKRLWWPWHANDEKGELPGATLTALLSVFAVFWFLWAANKSRKVIPPLPPGPRGFPLVGYLPFLGTNLHRKFEELAGVYGPIYKVWLGNKLWVVVSSPLLVKEVVRDQDTIFANHDNYIAALAVTYGGADVTLLPYGPDWRKLRKIFTRDLLSNANLDGSFTLRREEVKKSIRKMYDKIGTPVDVGELALVTVMNTIVSMVWGGTLQGDQEGTDIGSEFKSMLWELMVLVGKPNVSDFFSVLARFDLQGIEREAKKIFQWCDRIFDCAIDKRMNLAKAKLEEGPGMTEQRKDFLQILLELTEREDAATSLSMTQVKALLLDIVIGASDTTTTTLEWLAAELMQHQEVMRKVNEELTQVVGLDNLVEESHLSKLHYLDVVIKETLRLHPALPLIVPRCPSQSSTLGGYWIPKGTRVLLNVWAIQRNPEFWDNPLEFQPERFLNDSIKVDYSGHNFNYFPFGSGRRICAGLPLAERMLKYIIASFLHAYEWKLPEDTKQDFSDRFGLVTKKVQPTVLIPTPRLSKSKLYTE